jgi:hypothetical protein
MRCAQLSSPYRQATESTHTSLLAHRKRAELLGLLRPRFARTEPWLQAGKYAAALMS